MLNLDSVAPSLPVDAALRASDATAHVTHVVRHLYEAERDRQRRESLVKELEARLDGKYVLRTSHDTLSSKEVALGYKHLIEVEGAFRTLKQELGPRPNYHRLEEPIRAHVLLCWLGLLLARA